MDLAHRLQRAVFRLNQDLQSTTGRAGLSVADAALLAELRHAPGTGVCELAAQASVGRSVMSERVSRLEAAGLVERVAPQPGGDRRRIGLHITASGREAFAVIARERGAWIESRLDRLSAAERETLKAAVELLDRLTDRPTAAKIDTIAMRQGGRT